MALRVVATAAGPRLKPPRASTRRRLGAPIAACGLLIASCGGSATTPPAGERQTARSTAAPDPSADAPPPDLGPLRGYADRLGNDACLAVKGPLIDVSHRADAPLIPASAIKIATAFVALEALGPDEPVDDATVGSLAADALRDSDNDAAQALLDLAGTRDLASTLQRAGLPADGFVQRDATGHDRSNQMSCRLAVELLRHPAHGAWLRDHLAIAGRTGTLAGRLTDTPAAGVVRAKTGSISGVAALVGWVPDPNNEPIIFAMMANQLVSPEEGVTLQDDLALVMAELA